MKINKILFASPMYREIEEMFKKQDVDQTKQFRFRHPEEVSEEDYLWADAFVAFKRPDNFTFGNIKWVHSFGAGVDKILKDVEWKDDVVLTRTVCSFGQKISEYCLSYILRDLQNHDRYEDLQKQKEWRAEAPSPLYERQVTVYGTGVIGQEVAKTLSSFGMKVYGVSLSGKQKKHFKDVFSSENGSHDVLAEADYVINTMPLTEKTRGMFDKALFNQSSNAVFINVGRGESVDNRALLEALDDGKVRKAILDVFQEEPLPENDPFWTHPNVVVTPHISAVTTPEEGVDCFIDTLHKIENNLLLSNQVDLNKGF
ncbi:D-2-hydroxyacid dehydrogenase [Bacillus shivajii]|uniref:D-2-hydroxyacid dehydrogenase n=1 Tax=Bacillus shivajii TaxID=1983719 RepID=UPI001CFC3259|nr:D-2-hydroxyacid dehydrogenase [Bacillus shivajii]UCZ55232.1 D-2-hydroxyacid dehydrogenase [Bacillus shivajii]